jgi:hypothetical protein
MMKKILIILAVLAAITGLGNAASGVYSKTVFYNDVSVGSWTAMGAPSVSYGTNGAYAAGGHTNYWRLNGTNLQGRLPVSQVYTSIWTNAVLASSNSTLLAWAPKDGILGYVVEKSVDNLTWTNWNAVAVTSTNYTDRGTNSWNYTSFTSLYSVIPQATGLGVWQALSTNVQGATNVLIVSGMANDQNGTYILSTTNFVLQDPVSFGATIRWDPTWLGGAYILAIDGSDSFIQTVGGPVTGQWPTAGAPLVLYGNQIVTNTLSSLVHSALTSSSPLNGSNITAGTVHSSWGYVDPSPTNAVENIQRSSTALQPITLTNVATLMSFGSAVFDIVTYADRTNGLDNYVTAVAGITSSTTYSNQTIAVSIPAGCSWGILTTNVVTGTNLWIDIAY